MVDITKPWQVALAPWANGVQARPLGLPFPMAWQLAGIVLSTVVIGAVLVLDRRTPMPRTDDA